MPDPVPFASCATAMSQGRHGRAQAASVIQVTDAAPLPLHRRGAPETPVERRKDPIVMAITSTFLSGASLLSVFGDANPNGIFLSRNAADVLPNGNALVFAPHQG